MHTLPAPIDTDFTRMMGCEYPVIVAPMFLVSNEAMVVAGSEAGGIGSAPSLNWRSAVDFDAALGRIKAATQKPYGINLIVNKSNIRLKDDLAAVVKHKVPLVITSLGNPKEVIEAVHSYSGKVICDVTTLDYALKVQELGADGVVAVCAGAGGHAGNLSPLTFIPYLKEKLTIPIIAAGGIATGSQILSVRALGASAVHVGTRFIASDEAAVAEDYKAAIINAAPEDIVLTKRISGTAAAVIKTPFIEKLGYELPAYERWLRRYPKAKKYLMLWRYVRGNKLLADSPDKPSWKTVWSAGQGVGLIHDAGPIAAIMHRMVREYHEARQRL